MSINFELISDISYIDRTSYDTLTMMENIGGMVSILMLFFSTIATPFAKFRTKAILTSRMFHLSAENRQSIFGDPNLTEKQISDHHLHKNENGEIVLKIPDTLFLNYMIYLCCLGK